MCDMVRYLLCEHTLSNSTLLCQLFFCQQICVKSETNNCVKCLQIKLFLDVKWLVIKGYIGLWIETENFITFLYAILKLFYNRVTSVESRQDWALYKYVKKVSLIHKNKCTQNIQK